MNLTNSLEKIRTEVEDGNDHMQETINHFEQILTTMGETKLQNSKIHDELYSFQTILTELGEAFEEVTLSADRLATITQDMN